MSYCVTYDDALSIYFDRYIFRLFTNKYRMFGLCIFNPSLSCVFYCVLYMRQYLHLNIIKWIISCGLISYMLYYSWFWGGLCTIIECVRIVLLLCVTCMMQPIKHELNQNLCIQTVLNKYGKKIIQYDIRSICNAFLDYQSGTHNLPLGSELIKINRCLDLFSIGMVVIDNSYTSCIGVFDPYIIYTIPDGYGVLQYGIIDFIGSKYGERCQGCNKECDTYNILFKCGHKFCMSCTLGWFRINHSCLICRNEL